MLSPPEPVASRTTYDLLPVGDGCRLTFGLDVDLPAGARIDELSWRSEARNHLARVRAVLAEGAAPASDDSTAGGDGPWSLVLDDAFAPPHPRASLREQTEQPLPGAFTPAMRAHNRGAALPSHTVTADVAGCRPA